MFPTPSSPGSCLGGNLDRDWASSCHAGALSAGQQRRGACHMVHRLGCASCQSSGLWHRVLDSCDHDRSKAAQSKVACCLDCGRLGRWLGLGHALGCFGSDAGSGLGEPSLIEPGFSCARDPPAGLVDLMPGAGALALLSLVKSLSVGKAIGVVSHRKSEPSRELVAQGIACSIGGFLRCVPTSSSPSRTAIIYEHGARTRLAGGFSGVLTLLVLALAPKVIMFVPMAALAGVVVVSAGGTRGLASSSIDLGDAWSEPPSYGDYASCHPCFPHALCDLSGPAAVDRDLPI